MKILIYDDKNFKYVEGNVIQTGVQADVIEYGDIGDTYRKFIPGLTRTYSITAANTDLKEHIELDPTTMKTIALYNKEAEIEKLDRKIKRKNETLIEKQKAIKALEEILQDRQKRVERLKEFVADIYNLDLDKSDEEDDDYYDYDY